MCCHWLATNLFIYTPFLKKGAHIHPNIGNIVYLFSQLSAPYFFKNSIFLLLRLIKWAFYSLHMDVNLDGFATFNVPRYGTLLPIKRRHTVVYLYILLNSLNSLIRQWTNLRCAATSSIFL